MKRNKFLIFSLAILVLLVGAMLFTACGHKHEVMKWKTIVEPTCTNEGTQRGVCVECGEVIEEVVAPVDDNHVWGDWVVTTAPTYGRDGKGELTRVCRENSEHTQSVSVPMLSSNGAGYKEYEVFKEASVISEGKLSAVYESEYGDIAFTITMPKKTFDESSVEDAVLLGSSNKDLIRKGSGNIDSGFNETGKASYAKVSYEYGTDYVHTYYEGEDKHMWLSRTSTGALFAVAQYGSDDPQMYPKATELDMDGFHYYVSRADRDFYGAEGLLYNAYMWGKKNANRKYEEGTNTDAIKDTNGKVVNRNGETVYWFSFDYYSIPQNYCLVTCMFTLTDSGAIKYIRMNIDTYVRDPSGNNAKNDQFELYYDPNSKKDIAYLKGNSGNPTYKEVVEYTQELKEDYPDEPKHEYTEDAFKIADFDVMCKGKVIGEEITDETPTLQTGGGSNILNLKLSNVSPTTAKFDYDPFVIYRINDNGVRIKLGASTDEDSVWYTGSASNIILRSKLSGYIKLAFVTDRCEKIVTIYCAPSSPQILYPCVYEYTDSGYVWNQSTNKKIEATVYVGQPLIMKSVISSAYKDYVDPSYQAQVASGPDGATVTSIPDTDTWRFVATQTGEYMVEMRSMLQNAVCARVTITVKSAPYVYGLLSGEYTAKFKKFEATVSFAEPDGEGKIYATVTTNKGTEIIYVYYDTQYNVIRYEHKDGANLEVGITLNEAYKLVLTNPTGFGSGKEKAIMYQNSAEAESNE